MLTNCQFTNEPNREYQGAFSRMAGFADKRVLFSPPPPASIFFCSRSNFRAITRLETLATLVSLAAVLWMSPNAPPKERLLTSELHSFLRIGQSQLGFHF